MTLLKAFLLTGASFSLALGLTLPLVRFEKLYFFSEQPSLAAIIQSLWSGGNQALSLLVALFSVVFPMVKLLVVGWEAMGKRKSGFLARLLPIMAKWSMMDVLLVALAIVAAKTTGFASAFTQPGLWFYAGSAIAVTLLSVIIRSGA